MVEKYTLFPRTFLGIISLVEISTFFRRTFLRCDFSGRKINVAYAYFFLRNFDGQKFDWLSLNFSSKSPWCTSVLLKFASYNLQYVKKNCRKLVSWVFTGKLLYHIIFGRLHCHEVTLVKKVINHYYKKVKQRFSTKTNL